MPYFNGILSLSNVNVKDWAPVHDSDKGVDDIELRLAFDKWAIDSTTKTVDEKRIDSGEIDQVAFDVLM